MKNFLAPFTGSYAPSQLALISFSDTDKAMIQKALDTIKREDYTAVSISPTRFTNGVTIIPGSEQAAIPSGSDPELEELYNAIEGDNQPRLLDPAMPAHLPFLGEEEDGSELRLVTFVVTPDVVYAIFDGECDTVETSPINISDILN